MADEPSDRKPSLDKLNPRSRALVTMLTTKMPAQAKMGLFDLSPHVGDVPPYASASLDLPTMKVLEVMHEYIGDALAARIEEEIAGAEVVDYLELIDIVQRICAPAVENGNGNGNQGAGRA